MPSMLDLSAASFAAFILFIGILIFVHELGHFLAAKYFDIKVLKFSLGFGPPLFRFTRGETVYQVALLPLGGFVKMLGDLPGDEIPVEDRKRAFSTVPVYQRAIVASAGPAFNLVFPIACYFAFYLLGPAVISPVVGQVDLRSPAAEAGLQRGDRVLTIDGSHVWAFDRMVELIRERPGKLVSLEVLRDGQVLPLQVVPKADEDTDDYGATVRIGRIGVAAYRLGTRVGVDGSPALEAGFSTGDRVLSIDGEKADRLEGLDQVIAKRAGKTVQFLVARPIELRAGHLFSAQIEEVAKIDIRVPAEAKGLADLGLYPPDSFVKNLEAKGPAFRAGLRQNDRIIGVDGQPAVVFETFLLAMQRAEDQPVPIRVRRDGKELDLKIRNDRQELTNEITGKPQIYYDAGLGLGDLPRKRSTMRYRVGDELEEKAALSIGEALVASVERTGRVIGSILMQLAMLFSGDISVKNVGGPILMFQVAAEAAERGLLAYLNLLAWISVNLGIINLLPVPVFDGGHLLFCAVEAIRRKPVSLRVREAATIAGLVFLAALIVLAFSNDISRLSGSLFK